MTDRDRVILGAMTPGEILAELARLRVIERTATNPAFVAWVAGQARVARAGQRAAVNLAARRNGVEAEQMSRSAREFGGHGDMLDAFLAAIEQPEVAS